MYLKTPRIAPLTDATSHPSSAPRCKARPFPVGRRSTFSARSLARQKRSPAFLAGEATCSRKKNDLPGREREIVILRTGFNCRSGYEWVQHVEIGKRAGITDAEIAALKKGAGANWSPADAALIRACDDLHARQFVSNETWAALRAHFSEKQCMDVVFTCGQYTQVSMMLNSFGVQLDEGQTLDPDLDIRCTASPFPLVGEGGRRRRMGVAARTLPNRVHPPRYGDTHALYPHRNTLLAEQMDLRTNLSGTP